MEAYGQYEPGGHRVHDGEPAADENVPAGQKVQFAAPAAENEPLGQSVALMELKGQKEPAGQS